MYEALAAAAAGADRGWCGVSDVAWLIGQEIKRLRKEAGLSQAKLAVLADTDPATLNRVEQGKGNPLLSTLERVAEVLGVEMAEFFPRASNNNHS